MSQIKIYHIINRITRKEDFTATYEGCLEYYNIQDKSYRRLHRIINDTEFNKIIKKQQLL